ncbi:MAG: hypothetical protein IPN03_00545 [Holophagales bacterium]|nr:hypothetical protein [Holophagales bacterium]
MNAARNPLPLLLVMALAAAPAAAQSKAKPKPAAAAKTSAPAPAKATPANATLKTVQDRRSEGHFPRCTLGIELPDIPAHEARASRVVVMKAVDDLGTNLVREDAADARLEPTQRGSFGKPKEGPAPPTIVFAELKNPPRKATILKEVSGEIELYIPGRDPNGEAGFPKILSMAGKPLAHAALKANGVEISVLSQAQIEAERKKAGDAERAKARKEGVTDEDTIKSMVEYAVDSFPKGGEGQIVLRVKDPKKAIQDFKMADGEGNPQFNGKSDEAGFTILEFWGEKPKPDWTMKVLMQSDKSLVRHTFVFRDVPLP